MPSKAAEQGRAGFERIQKMKGGNRPAGAMRLVAIARNYQRRAPVALDHTRGGDANDSAMPSLPIDHHTERISQPSIFGEALIDRLEYAPFFFLTFAVQLV